MFRLFPELCGVIVVMKIIRKNDNYYYLINVFSLFSRINCLIFLLGCFIISNFLIHESNMSDIFQLKCIMYFIQHAMYVVITRETCARRGQHNFLNVSSAWFIFERSFT
jgi:hypothetical protein